MTRIACLMWWFGWVNFFIFYSVIIIIIYAFLVLLNKEETDNKKLHKNIKE